MFSPPSLNFPGTIIYEKWGNKNKAYGGGEYKVLLFLTHRKAMTDSQNGSHQQ